jgi:hypothetical protein
MFSFSGLFARDTAETSSSPCEDPINYTVFKDGIAFAILNATPALAARTITGFIRSTPDADWTYRPC